MVVKKKKIGLTRIYLRKRHLNPGLFLFFSVFFTRKPEMVLSCKALLVLIFLVKTTNLLT